MIKQGSGDQAALPQIVVVQHWLEELKREVVAALAGASHQSH